MYTQKFPIYRRLTKQGIQVYINLLLKCKFSSKRLQYGYKKTQKGLILKRIENSMYTCIPHQ